MLTLLDTNQHPTTTRLTDFQPTIYGNATQNSNPVDTWVELADHSADKGCHIKSDAHPLMISCPHQHIQSAVQSRYMYSSGMPCTMVCNVHTHNRSTQEQGKNHTPHVSVNVVLCVCPSHFPCRPSYDVCLSTMWNECRTKCSSMS